MLMLLLSSSSSSSSLVVAAAASTCVVGVAVVLSCLRPRRSTSSSSIRTMVIFGSGGHTTEMLRLTQGLDRRRYAPLYYVVGATDTTSEPKARATAGAATPTEWLRIPRAREVGQSWPSTVFATLRAFAAALALLRRSKPDLVIANGPGTCLPLCVAARLLFGARLVFCESWCRVQDLSLTGKLLYPLSHRFIVHWPRLQTKYPAAEYIGRLC